ncbi:hypothetical protein [Bartonella jaculi]|uniref:Uncharacterized protein n=1 Tax=Bartonella jaculi TaxID=686226 RepID=A0ABP9NB70_9HYPH
MWDVFLNGGVLSCIVVAFLGFILLGAKNTAVTWGVFLKAVVFCAFAGVALGFAYKGAKRFDITWGLFLKGLVGIALLELLLVLLMRVQR